MSPIEQGDALVLEDNDNARLWLVDCVRAAFPALHVHQASDIASARELLAQNDFVLALVDLGLPDGNGLEIVRELGSRDPPVHVIVATIYDDDHHLMTALKAGAQGYVLKDQDRERIVSYLLGIKKDRPALSAASSRRLIAHFNNRGQEANALGITPRERDVLRLVGKGCNVDETARLLGISADTVKGYLKNIYSRLGVSNRAELTLEAVRLGLIDAD